MNYAIVFRLLGYVLMIEGALLLLPAAASLVYGEWMVLGVFLLTAAVSAGIGYALHTIKARSKVFYMREGFAATSLCWVFISVMGAVPFVLTGCIPNPVDALFETVSGFTTSVTLDGAVCLSAREDGEFIRFLFTDMRREKTREELNQLFYPDLSRMTAGEKGELYGTEYLVCKQIIRDHDEFAGRRGCRINAEPGKEGGFTIYFTLPKK